jgi:hypothetical protein
MIFSKGEPTMKTSSLLISATIALIPAISLAQAPVQSQVPIKQTSSNPVQDAFNVFNSDFSSFSDLAEVEAINGPKKLELARKMKADAQAWFNALQTQLVSSAKENASLHDQISSNQKTITTLTQQVSALKVRSPTPDSIQHIKDAATIADLNKRLAECLPNVNHVTRPMSTPNSK